MPPAPPPPPQHIAPPAPPPPSVVNLQWDYAATEQKNIVFNLYHATNLPSVQTKWCRRLTTTNLKASVIVNPGVHFYTVTASNILTGKESTFAYQSHGEFNDLTFKRTKTGK